MAPLVVGFDLDMTLIDSRPGIGAVWRALAQETGVDVDVDLVTSRLGPPLDEELVQWFPAEQVAALGDRFRELYPSLAIAPTLALPGAREAIDAVRAHGGRVVVVTGKYEPNARLHLEHLGIEVDEVVGWHWGPAKGEALRERGASVYVGDHLGDVRGARVAGAFCVGVATGPIPADELAAAGADVVLPDLTGFPDWLAAHLLGSRLESLDEALRQAGSVLVAFSGGADSAFLLAAAARALGPEHVVAATARSSSLPTAELAAARAVVDEVGVRHVVVDTAEHEREGYRANAGDRCFFCKAELLDVLGPLAAELGLAAVATGTNADDVVAGFRPGIRAAAERGALTPLADAGLTKAQVRAASRAWGLSTWDKPAAACLASRVAYGVEVTPSRLARVERAEVALRAALAEAGHQVRDLRVRDLGDLARVEVDAALVEAITGPALEAVRGAGFADVEVDPRGFRSGAMNELLPEPERYR
ncbi:MAG TPA: ATP-dependent sacrificial sulfur transferase LarE [Motilibacteraceae bacterium]|nr:ATP-dependent sacrificial sulfur transferase LarE [Motilibacteraceae bacterium]